MLKRIQLYGFPLYIVFAEGLVSHYLLVPPRDANNTGSSIAVAGLSLLFPVLIPKQQPVVLADGSPAILILDMGLVQCAWLFLAGLAGLWIYCLYLANQPVPPVWLFAPAPMIIGVGTFVVGVVFTEIKDRRT